MLMINPQRRALLSTIAWAEGTSTSPVTKNNGYDVLVTGMDGKPEAFTDYSRHPFTNRPAKQINGAGLLSTASGRYQILLHFWSIYSRSMSLPDFSPSSQDLYALQQMRERSALPLIDAGSFDDAIMALAGLWASLPGHAYPGQRQHTIESLRPIFVANGGVLHSSLALASPTTPKATTA